MEAPPQIDYDALAKQHGAIDYDALAAQHGAITTNAAEQPPPSLWQELNTPPPQLGGDIQDAVRNKISNVVGMHVPPQYAGPVAEVLNAVTAIPASMVEFGRRNLTPLNLMTMGAAEGIPSAGSAIQSAGKPTLQAVGKTAGALADNPISSWAMGYRLTKAAKFLSKIGESLADEAEAAKTVPAKPEAAPNVLTPPAAATEKTAWQSLSPEEQSQLEKEIADWNQGEAEEKAATKGAGAVKRPANFTADTDYFKPPEPEPDYMDLLQKSLDRVKAAKAGQ